MYLEYAKNELANSHTYVDTYNYLLSKTNNTWVHEKVLAPYFGPKVGRKKVGNRILFWIIVPSIAILWETMSYLWRRCCSRADKEKN